jgi:GxxExxY protein
MVDNKYKYSEITEKIIGCSLNIHKQLGNGFPEIIYHRCLEIEFNKSGLKYKTEFDIPVFYDNIEVGKRRADFIVEDVVLVELKALQNLDDYCISQVLNYLKAFKLEVGLLINFGEKSLKFKRLINTINK